MTFTSTNVCELLGLTTTDSHITQIEKTLPLVIDHVHKWTNGGFAKQHKEFAISVTTSTGVFQLTNYPVIEKSVYVTSTDRGTMYYGDALLGCLPSPTYYIPSTYVEDYVISYTTGGFTPTSTAAGGRITPTTGVYVTYGYIDMRGGGQEACAKMIENMINKTGGVQSESVGSLSRSYTMGMDETVKELLRPYKRAGWA